MKFRILSLLFLLLLPAVVVAGEFEGKINHALFLNAANVHWGYFSKELVPVVTIESGDVVMVEMATHHAGDDWDKMIKGDAGMEDVYTWTQDEIGEEFRGATGGGDGVHILTGPIYVNGAEPGDILKVEILDLTPRANPEGKTFGSNAAAWWGFQARVNKADGTPFTAGTFTSTPDENDEVVTIFEIVEIDGLDYAVPSYQFEWPVITGTFRKQRIRLSVMPTLLNLSFSCCYRSQWHNARFHSVSWYSCSA